jgi:hypothetical protein
VISAWCFSLYINDLISELKAVNSGISISDLNIFVLSVALTNRVINVPAYTCSFLFSMDVSPSQTEISESFCLCPSKNIKQLFAPLYVRRQRQA